MKIQTIKAFLKHKKEEAKTEKREAVHLVQKAVDVSQRIKTEMDEYIRFNKGRLEYIATQAPPGILGREGKKMLRRFNRRIKALEKIKNIQAQAFKRAYGVDPPWMAEGR